MYFFRGTFLFVGALNFLQLERHFCNYLFIFYTNIVVICLYLKKYFVVFVILVVFA